MNLSLSISIQEELQAVADRIRSKLGTISESIIEVGEDLLQVKEKLPHGEFGEWILLEFNFSHSTANNFMILASLDQDILTIEAPR